MLSDRRSHREPGKKEVLPTSSAKTAPVAATIFYAVLGVLFCQIGSASASCMTMGCSTSGPNFDCSGSATFGGQQYCCCNNLGYMCSSSSYCYGGGSSGSSSGSSGSSSGSSFGEFSVYIKRLRNAPNKDSAVTNLYSDESDPCIQINGPNGVCGGTDTKWDNHNPNFYQSISCGCIDANGQKPKLDVWDNDDHPTSQCTAVRFAEKLGSFNLGISSRSEYDFTWDSGMSLTIEKTFDTTKCQPPRPPQPPPPPPSPSPPPPPPDISTNSMSTPTPGPTSWTNSMSTPTPGPTSCTPPLSWCNDGVSTCDTRSSLSQSLLCNTVSYGCCCSGTYEGSLCEECATGSCPSSSSSPSPSSSSSTSGNIVGIVVGALVGVGALAAIVTAVICIMNQKKEVTPTPASPLPVARPVQAGEFLQEGPLPVAQPVQQQAAQPMQAHFAAA